MFYKPHKLYKRTKTEVRDEFNRLVSSGGQDEYIGMCRCDDNTDKRFETTDGSMYIPKFHIVAEGNVPIEAGDYLVVMDGDTVRGEGEVYNHKHLNRLLYTDIWV